MELSQEFLIDMAINAGGYLFAGIISVLIYSLFQKKKPAVAVDELVAEKQTHTASTEKNISTALTNERKVEFITFGQEQQSYKKEPIIEKPEVPKENNSRMNRKEAIGFAKKMLLAGASHEKIKKLIPVSESELALLSLNIK